MGMKYFEDLNVGDSWTSAEYAIDHEEMLAYGRANDPWPFHVDPEAASRSPFGGLIASGGYTITLMYRLFHEIVNQPGRGIVKQLVEVINDRERVVLSIESTTLMASSSK